MGREHYVRLVNCQPPYENLWPPVETWNLMVEWTDGQSYTREACTVQSLKDPEEGRQDSWGKGGKDCPQCHLVRGKVRRLDNVFLIAKQMDHTNHDVIGMNSVRNDAGELALTNDEEMKVWVEHYARLLNCQPPYQSLWTGSTKRSARLNAARLLALISSSLRCWKLIVNKELSW